MNELEQLKKDLETNTRVLTSQLERVEGEVRQAWGEFYRLLDRKTEVEIDRDDARGKVEQLKRLYEQAIKLTRDNHGVAVARRVTLKDIERVALSVLGEVGDCYTYEEAMAVAGTLCGTLTAIAQFAARPLAQVRTVRPALLDEWRAYERGDADSPFSVYRVSVDGWNARD